MSMADWGPYTPFKPRKCPSTIYGDVQCPGTTGLFMSKGVTDLSTKGNWYERCDVDKSHPELGHDRHFVQWHPEYPQNASLPANTLQNLLDSRPTPSSSPVKQPPSETYDGSIPTYDGSTPLPPDAEASMRDLLAHLNRSSASKSTSQPAAPIISSPTVTVPALADPPDTTETPQNIVIKCPGPLCLQQGTFNKPAKACLFKYCRRCCLYQQSIILKACKASGHRASGHQEKLLAPVPTQITAPSTIPGPTSQPTQITAPSTIPGPTSQTTSVPNHFYDRSKALDAEHYNLRMDARQAAPKADYRKEQAKLEQELTAQRQLLYWNTTGDDNPQTLIISAPNFPHFKLKDCPGSVLECLELSSNGQDAFKRIETFDYSFMRWTSHDLDTVRNLNAGPRTLLYRKSGVKNGDSIAEELEALSVRTKPRKRPVAETDFVSPVNNRRVKPRHSSPSPPSNSRHSSPIPTSSSRSASPLPEVSEIVAATTTPTPAIAKQPTLADAKDAAATAFDLEHEPFGEERDLLAGSEKGKGIFPLMYVVSMARFFRECQSMGMGNAEDRFRAVFPRKLLNDNKTWPRASYYKAMTFWQMREGALKALWDRFIRAGYSRDGLWSNFSKEASDVIKAEALASKNTPSTSTSTFTAPAIASASNTPSTSHNSDTIKVEMGEVLDLTVESPSGLQVAPQVKNEPIEPTVADLATKTPKYHVLVEGEKEILFLDDDD
ncbi:hypothetical protein H0H93_014270 [Arthromyces matolae]|nr:hypothetical protein H0H93_014270 [Arthromyces matolae]